VNLSALRSRVYDRLDEDPSDPQRWPASVVTEYLNDAVQVLSSRARLNVTSTTITQRPETLYYDLPSDCIAVLAIYDDQDETLALTSWREFDRTQIPGGILPEAAGRLKARWVRATGLRATHAYTFGLDELVLWPMIGPAETTDQVFLSDELIGDAATATLTLSLAGDVGIWWNGSRLKEVASAAAVGEFSVSSTTVTLGQTPSTDDVVQAIVSGLDALVIGEIPTGDIDGSNYTYTIVGTPADTMTVAVYHNGIRLINMSEFVEEAVAAGESYTLATGTFYVSGTTVYLTTVPDTGDWIIVDYATDEADVVFGEEPDGDIDGENTEYVLAQEPSHFSEVAVFLSGVRLHRAEGVPEAGEYTIAGQVIRLGLAPEETDGLWVDYVRIPEEANIDYTLHYLRDMGDNLADDDDTPSLPETFHEHLIDYAVSRCLLPKARGPRIKRAVEGLNKFAGRVEQARYHNRNVALDNTVTSGGAW
jgi:hypothetical protein